MAKSRRQTQFLLSRNADRTNINLQRRSLPDGTTTIGYSIDLSTAKLPERTYYGKECWFEYDRGVVEVFFAHKSRDTKTLRSLITINMTPGAVVQWLDSVDNMSNPSLAEIVKLVNIDTEQVKAIGGEAEQTIELTANIANCAVSGSETAIDFYKISPFSILKLQSGKQADIDPQVRIDMRTSLFLGLIDGLKSIRDGFPKEALALKEVRES